MLSFFKSETLWKNPELEKMLHLYNLKQLFHKQFNVLRTFEITELKPL